MANYTPPAFKHRKFNCPICEVYAAQHWYPLLYQGNHLSGVMLCRCESCGGFSYWYTEEERIILPAVCRAPQPHPDMPHACVADYNEAREVYERSPKAAGALLRLCVQKLLIALGKSGDRINDSIRELVREGLPVQVQQALDICRVVGNNAVHPGAISIEDDPALVFAMFDLINQVVEDRIARPKAIEAMYAALPQGAREAIERRDQGGA